MAATPLYNAVHHGTRITLTAERDEGGRLVIAGQDIGAAPNEIFGRDDYEYRYTLEPQSESDLRSALADDLGTTVSDDMATEELLQLAFRRTVLATPTDLRPYLGAHSIDFSFSSF